MQNMRIGSLVQVADHGFLIWPLAFILSALLAMVGYFLVRRFAPEAGIRHTGDRRGAGRAASGSLVASAAGEIYRRDGDAGRRHGARSRRANGTAGRQRRANGTGYLPHAQPEARHTLLATGAAAGLSAAFNAPLAGILFIIEEMRPQFRYNLISIKAVFTGVIMSSIVFRIFNGESAIIEVGKLSDAPVNTLWLYLILGMIFGCVGPLFNSGAAHPDMFQRIHGGNTKKWVLIGGLIGGMCGVLGLIQPAAAGAALT